jgi:hypothetical protein
MARPRDRNPVPNVVYGIDHAIERIAFALTMGGRRLSPTQTQLLEGIAPQLDRLANEVDPNETALKAIRRGETT